MLSSFLKLGHSDTQGAQEIFHALVLYKCLVKVQKKSLVKLSLVYRGEKRRTASSEPWKWLKVFCAAGINTKCLGFNSYVKNLKDGMDNKVVTLSVRSQLFRFIKTAEEDFRRD